MWIKNLPIDYLKHRSFHDNLFFLCKADSYYVWNKGEVWFAKTSRTRGGNE